MQNATQMDETIDLTSTTVDEIDKCLANSEFHMGDLVTRFRVIRDTLYSYERFQHPGSDYQDKHLILKAELEDLLLIFCETTKSMKKREAYLEGKVDDQQKKLDEQHAAKDEWELVAKEDITKNTKTNELKKTSWTTRVPWT